MKSFKKLYQYSQGTITGGRVRRRTGILGLFSTAKVPNFCEKFITPFDKEKIKIAQKSNDLPFKKQLQ